MPKASFIQSSCSWLISLPPQAVNKSHPLVLQVAAVDPFARARPMASFRGAAIRTQPTPLAVDHALTHRAAHLHVGFETLGFDVVGAPFHRHGVALVLADVAPGHF